MLRYLLGVTSLLVALASSSPALAQPAAEWGGLGYGFFGGFAGGYNVEDELAQTGSLGSDFALGTIGMQFGGGGEALINGTVVIAGKGLGWAIPSESPQGARVLVSGGGGGFDLGWAVLNKDYNLLFPFMGLGGYAMDVEITNELARQNIQFGDGAVAPDQTKSFSASFFVFDFGLSYQRLLFFGSGGFAVGAEAGLMVTISRGEWEDEDANTVGGLEDLGVSGGYLRVTLGGGGFLFEEEGPADGEGADSEGASARSQ
jgi:hypothetical protein